MQHFGLTSLPPLAASCEVLIREIMAQLPCAKQIGRVQNTSVPVDCLPQKCYTTRVVTNTRKQGKALAALRPKGA